MPDQDLEKDRLGPCAARVSLVICTLDRPACLRRCLEGLAQQTLRPQEIIIVCGSRTSMPPDPPDAAPAVRVVDAVGRNISVSRNAGVRAARGELIALIDDDAVPDRDWLKHLIAPFSDARVAGVGGVVYDSRVDPPRLDFAGGLVNICGSQVRVRKRAAKRVDPPRGWYNNVCGCSCTFRRSSLMQIGGFDESMEFGFEETDVCLRLVRAGFRIAHAAEAVVYHGYTPGGHREDDLLARNWYAEIKNQLYCGLQNGRGVVPRARVVTRVVARVCKLHLRFALASGASRISARQAREYRQATLRGLRTGIVAGLGERSLPFVQR